MPSQILSKNRDDLEESSHGFLAQEDKNIYGKKRHCRKCNGHLSLYNNGDICWSCQKKIPSENIRKPVGGRSKYIAAYNTPKHQIYLDLSKEICSSFNVSPLCLSDIRWLRGREVYPRQVLVFMLHEDFNFSYAHIMRLLRFSNGNSIINLCQKGKKLFQENMEIHNIICKIRIKFLKNQKLSLTTA